MVNATSEPIKRQIAETSTAGSCTGRPFLVVVVVTSG
jgi:hypothetical protein